MQVSRWGNSLAIRLPASVVEALRLSEGDDVEVTIADERLLAVARTPDRQELIRRLDEFRDRLPADFKFDRSEASER